jgi:hypothetical protein
MNINDFGLHERKHGHTIPAFAWRAEEIYAISKTDFGTKSAYYETGVQSTQNGLVHKSSSLF